MSNPRSSADSILRDSFEAIVTAYESKANAELLDSGVITPELNVTRNKLNKFSQIYNTNKMPNPEEGNIHERMLFRLNTNDRLINSRLTGVEGLKANLEKAVLAQRNYEELIKKQELFKEAVLLDKTNLAKINNYDSILKSMEAQQKQLEKEIKQLNKDRNIFFKELEKKNPGILDQIREPRKIYNEESKKLTSSEIRSNQKNETRNAILDAHEAVELEAINSLTERINSHKEHLAEFKSHIQMVPSPTQYGLTELPDVLSNSKQVQMARKADNWSAFNISKNHTMKETHKKAINANPRINENLSKLEGQLSNLAVKQSRLQALQQFENDHKNYIKEGKVISDLQDNKLYRRGFDKKNKADVKEKLSNFSDTADKENKEIAKYFKDEIKKLNSEILQIKNDISATEDQLNKEIRKVVSAPKKKDNLLATDKADLFMENVKRELAACQNERISPNSLEYEKINKLIIGIDEIKADSKITACEKIDKVDALLKANKDPIIKEVVEACSDCRKGIKEDFEKQIKNIHDKKVEVRDEKVWVKNKGDEPKDTIERSINNALDNSQEMILLLTEERQLLSDKKDLEKNAERMQRYKDSRAVISKAEGYSSQITDANYDEKSANAGPTKHALLDKILPLKKSKADLPEKTKELIGNIHSESGKHLSAENKLKTSASQDKRNTAKKDSDKTVTITNKANI